MMGDVVRVCGLMICVLCFCWACVIVFSYWCCCYGWNMMGGVVRVCGCGDWSFVSVVCVIWFSCWLLVVMGMT